MSIEKRDQTFPNFPLNTDHGVFETVVETYLACPISLRNGAIRLSIVFQK